MSKPSGKWVGRAPHERRKDTEAADWGKLYDLRAWRGTPNGLRWRTLVRDRFTCQMPGCGRIEPDTSKLHADHKRPHKGDMALFLDPGNVWTLCEACHNSVKQAEERGGRMARTDGWRP